MKISFNTEQDLSKFLSSAPRVAGSAKVQGEDLDSARILSRCLALVPEIFEYKALLAKGEKGLGSGKSVMRFSDVVSDRLLNEKYEAFVETLADVDAEVQLLIEAGASEALAGQLQAARSKVAAFQLIRSTIDGFRARLNQQMAKVEESYLDVSATLKAKQREMSKVLDSETYGILVREIDAKHTSAARLMEVMDEYCALQIGYNAILMG